MVSPTTWEQFEKDYEYIIKFGEKAFNEKLAAQVESNTTINNKMVLETITEAYRAKPLGEVLDTIFQQALDTALRAYHSQRADMSPQEQNRALLGTEPVQRPHFEMPDWAIKMDIADNPVIQDVINQNNLNEAVDNYNRDPSQTNRNELVHKFKMTMGSLQAKLKQEYEHQLKLKATPTVPAPKPNIPPR